MCSPSIVWWLFLFKPAIRERRLTAPFTGSCKYITKGIINMSRPKIYVTDEQISERRKEKNKKEYAKLLSDPEKLKKKREYQRLWHAQHKKCDEDSSKLCKKTVSLKLTEQEIDLITADAKNNSKSFSAYISEIVSRHARSLIIPIDDSQSSQNTMERSDLK